MEIIQYFLIANVCLSICYLFFKMISKNETNFRQLRFFLLVSIIISLLVPLNNFKINAGLFSNKSIVSNPTYTQQLSIKDNFASDHIINQPFSIKKETSNLKNIEWILLVEIIYISIAIILIFRVIMQIAQLVYRYHKAEKSKYLQFTILSNTYYKNSFSFFNWIYINKKICLNEDKDKIIAHEIIHASQYHSFDLILIELLSAVIWFNPVIWMMRKSMQLLHEYLADEGALSTGIDKLRYQALLINQLTEERLICISSSFNHSLIKKRMIMMSKSKLNQKSKLKIFALLPLSALIFLIVAIINGFYPESSLAGPKKLNRISLIELQKNENADYKDFVEDTTRNRKVRKSRKNKISDKTRDTSFVNSSVQKDTSKLTYVMDYVKIGTVKNLDSVSIKSLELGIPKKTMFVSMHTFPDNRITFRSTNNNTSLNNTLYIVDGVEYSKENALSINPGTIAMINVVRGKSLMKIYTTKDYSAVVSITTKKLIK